MTRFIHDRFAKDYLEEALSRLGVVNLNREVTSEARFVDIYFTPTLWQFISYLRHQKLCG